MNNPNQTVSDKAIFSLFSGDDPEIVANPFALLAQIRSTGAVRPLPFPLAGMDRQIWMVTRMEEAVQVLKDHAHFTVDPSSIGVDGLLGRNRPETADTPTFFTSKTMLTVDDPDHRRLRMLVSKAFTPRYIEGLRPQVQEIADELLDRVGVVAHMRAFGEYTARLVADKRQHPADDLISQLIAIEEEGDRLSETEMISMITLLIFAGHETTSNLLATGTLMLLDHPAQLEQLKADPSLMPAAVEELLRFNGPATIAGPRYATEDMEFAGQHIKKGDVVFPILLSANHDERQFTQPEELEIARTLERHLAFGHGIHMCLGAPLARLEGDIAFTTLLKRMPNLRLSVPRESITWNFALNSRSLTALPVAF